MIYIVLREPTTSGGYVNRFAFSDQRTTLAINCGGASVLPAARITSMSEMANKLDISQAKGGMGQGVEWSASLADWDGAARTSASIFDGSARFYGWSAAIARSDSETASPDWINDVDHWMVTDVSTDGSTISITVGERWANDGRLLVFGQDGATVPLVVGGHDVWVKTSAVDPVRPITYRRKVPSWYSDGPTTATILDEETATFATSKVASDIFDFECGDAVLAADFYSALAAVGTVLVSGNDYSIECSTYANMGTAIRFYTGSLDFYAAEAAASVFISYPRRVAITAGADGLRGFSTGTVPALPLGIMEIIDGLLVFSPYSQNSHGDFACRTMIPTHIAWNPALGNDFSGTPGTPGESWAYNHVSDIRSAGEAEEAYQTPANDGTVASPQWLTVALGSGNPGAVLQIALRMNVAEPSDGANYSFYVVDLVARAFFYAPAPDPFVAAKSPFKKTDISVGTVPVGASFFSLTSRPSGEVFVNADFKFSSIADLHSYYRLHIGQRDVDTVCVIEVQSATLYGASDVSFGSASALVRTAAFPFPYAGYATNDRLDRAAATLIEQLAPYHGITISPAAPTFLPAAAQGGECLDASKTYRDNAIALLEETWQVLGVTAYGATPTDGQGLGEIPTPVSIVLGRFEDIVTEPVIEFCPVAGTLTKKAYVAYVDQPFDATNPGKFYGGWGHSMLPDSFVLTTPSWQAGTWTKTTPPPGEQPNSDSGAWYLRVYSGGTDTTWFDFPPTDYGYLLWKQCRAAYLVHKVKRGATYQFNGIYDESVVGQMWWESRRNGSRRIEWLCLQPRYLTYSVREAKPLAWSGSAVYIAGTLANYAGYDVSTWDNSGGDTLVVVDRTYDLLTGIGKYTVAIPPVPTVDAVAIYRDTLDAAHTIGRLVDTIDATAVTTKYTDTLEA